MLTSQSIIEGECLCRQDGGLRFRLSSGEQQHLDYVQMLRNIIFYLEIFKSIKVKKQDLKGLGIINNVFTCHEIAVCLIIVTYQVCIVDLFPDYAPSAWE